MAKKTTSTSLLFFLFSLLPCFLLCSCCCDGVKKNGGETNGIFVFGSSLVDNGNNNFLEDSKTRADYLPYGIDFPLGPSGRFSNGKNMIDALGELLKLPSLVPPFADPMTKGNKIVHGVNYASGGSGILDDTGSVSGRVINLNQQIRNFKKVTLPDLAAQVGCKSNESLSRILSDYLFVVATGGNDYLLNYLLPTSTPKLTLQAFTANLTTKLYRQIKKLYHLGGRKFVLISVYPIGCIPVVKAKMLAHQGCMEPLNQIALLFNGQLKFLVDVIKRRMPGSNLVYVNSYQIIRDIMDGTVSKGFNETGNACCEVNSNGILCKRGGDICGDRNSYVFFDGLHTTEAVNVLVATKAFASNLTTEAYPFNVQHLLNL